MLLPLYLRREPTTDPVSLAYCPPRQLATLRDVVAYRDPECTERAARWPWHYSNKPTRRNRRVMFNCYRWSARWLPEIRAA